MMKKPKHFRNVNELENKRETTMSALSDFDLISEYGYRERAKSEKAQSEIEENKYTYQSKSGSEFNS